jgi:rsbT antagonist protein RsbS
MNGHVPVLKLGPVLMVTIQIELHDRMAEDLQETVLNEIKRTGASAVLVDITALEIVDSFTGRILSETARMARIMNAQVVLVGMRPAVTMTLLEMGLNLPNLETAIDVEDGLARLGFELRRIDTEEQDTISPDDEEDHEGGH